MQVIVLWVGKLAGGEAISDHGQPGGVMTDRHGPPSAPPLSLAPERFGDTVVLTGIALLLRRERTQTRPAFQRFEAIAVLCA